MSHSLRCRLKGLCYKKILTDREVARLCKALDTADAIEDIKAEIEQRIEMFVSAGDFGNAVTVRSILRIIDKHISGKENE